MLIRQYTNLTFLCALLFLSANVRADESLALPKSLNSLEAYTPGALKVSHAKSLIDYCPDNTCDRFIGSKNGRDAVLANYAFLYLYYFSDYYYLSEWRTREDARDQAKVILDSKDPVACNRSEGRKIAACLLIHAELSKTLKLYMVRYDEKKKIVTPNPFSKQLSEAELNDARMP